jgi:hypothetical protein
MQIKTNWERSGNGDGNTNDQDDTLVDDNRSTFLAGNKTHILYFWELMEQNHMLESAVAELDDSQRADCDHVVVTSDEMGGNKRRKKDDSDEGQGKLQLFHNIGRLASAIQQNADTSRQKLIVEQQNADTSQSACRYCSPEAYYGAGAGCH